MDATPSLALPFILPGQAQKHVTHNEALRRLDALVQISVLDRDRTVPPSDPAPAQSHIVAAGASGAWAGHDDALAAWQDGAWAFFSPQPGWLAWLEDTGTLLVWTGTEWIEASGTGSGPASVNPASLVGVNTLADSTNKLAVKSDAVLFSHDDVTPGSGDVRHILNKASPSASASVVFQTGYSGRAEFGLTQDDDWHVKVSSDGVSWREALVADAETGRIGVGTAAPAGPLHVAGDDEGLVLENVQDLGAPWTIAVGRPGVYVDHLIIATGADITNTASHQLRFPKDGAPTFVNGIGIEDGEAVTSHTSGALAHYKPFDGTRGQLAFRGANDSGQAEFRIFGWVHDGGFSQKNVAAFEANASGARLGVNTHSPMTTLDVDGPVRVGRFTLATLPDAASNGEASLIYVADDASGPLIAYSDGTQWRRMTDGSVLV